MDAIQLMERGSDRLNNFDLDFVEKTQRILSFLRSKGVIPIKRAAVNGKLHTAYSAMLAQAEEENTTVDLATRRQADLYERGASTLFIKWLDDAVREQILLPDNGADFAQGKLHLSALLKKITTSE